MSGFFNSSRDEQSEKKELNLYQEHQIDVSKYNVNLPKGLIDLINDPGEQSKPSFTDPEQIMSIFQDLEDSNLYLIRASQELESTNDTIRDSIKEKKSYYTSKISEMNKKKALLSRQIKEKERLMLNLNKVRTSSISR